MSKELYLLRSQWEQIVPKRMKATIIEEGHEIPSLKPHKGHEKYLELTTKLQNLVRQQIANQIEEANKNAAEKRRVASKRRIAMENRKATIQKTNFILFFTFTAILSVVFTFLNFHNVLWLLGGEQMSWAVKAPFLLFAAVIAFSPYFFTLNKERGKLTFVGIAYGVEMLIYIVNLHWPLAKEQGWYIVVYSLYYAAYVCLLGLSLYRTFTDKNSLEKI
jgi:cation transport ATPase